MIKVIISVLLLLFVVSCTSGINATSSASRKSGSTAEDQNSTLGRLSLLEKQIIELLSTWTGSDSDKAKAEAYKVEADSLTSVISSDKSFSTNERLQYLQRSSLLKSIVETKITQGGGASNVDIEELKKQIYGTSPASIAKPDAPTRGSIYSTSGTVTFNWIAVTDALSYNVKIGTSAGQGNLFTGNVGNVLFKSLEGVASGTTVYAVVQGVNGTVTSEYSDPSLGIIVDTTAPTAPLNLVMSKTNGGAGVSVSNSGTFYLRWDTPTDAGSSVKDYTLHLYSQANCAGLSVDTSGLTSNSTTNATGVDGTTYSFKVRVFDQAGNYNISACSSSLLVDLSSPPALVTFTGDAGTHNSEINLTIDFPVSVDVASVVIRRAAGATAPADCSSGIVIKTYSSFTNEVYIDTTPTSDGVFSYRACVYDAAGNVTDSNVAQNIASMAYIHTIFATSTSYPGNIGGTIPADNYCQVAANGASLGGKWRAVMSMTGDQAKDRIVIKGVIKNRQNQTIANSKTELWSGTLQNSVGYNEFGVAVTGVVATGSNTSGSSSANCLEWTSSSTLVSRQVGDVTSSDSAWINNESKNCSGTYRLYCISQPEGYDLTSFTAATGAGINGDVDITIDFPADVSNFHTVTIRRLSGSAAPSVDCSSTGTVVKTFDTISGFHDGTFADPTPNPGYIYSYRACVYDSDGVLNATSSSTKIFSKGPRHTMFASSTSYTGDLGGLSGADAKCQTLATNAGLNGTFKAILSTYSTSASVRININGPVYGVDGALVANNQGDLWDGSIASFPKNEFGSAAAVGRYWTGSTSAGASSGSVCADWLTADVNSTGNNGQLGDIGTYWINRGSDNCTNFYGLYCISQ